MNFDRAFDLLMTHEGGFSDHSQDPGGATRFGVTEAVARDYGYTGDMRNLPLEVAKQIARARYWDRVKADELPARIRYAVFDAAYHSGPDQSIRWLQRAVGVNADAVLGPKTLAAVGGADPNALLMAVLGQRLRFLSGLPSWPSFGRGWSRRIAALMEM